MKSSKASGDKGKVPKARVASGTTTSSSSSSTSRTKKSQSTEGLRTTRASPSIRASHNRGDRTDKKSASNSSKPSESGDLFADREVAELALGEGFGAAFEKFWKTVADGIDRQTRDSLPRSTPIDSKIAEIQKRIKLNQAILKSANERMRGITFAAERQNLSQWKEGLAFRNPSREDLNRFKDVKALDLEIQKLRESKPDRNVFLKSSPGIVNFHETMESTLNMLDKIQKSDELDDYDRTYREIKSEFNLDFIKAPDMVAVSDEE